MSKKLKPSVCHICKDSSCGNDDHVLSTIKVERNVGDRMKIFLTVAYQLVDYDNLQPYEIKALFNALIDEHIIFEDPLNPT